MNWWLAGDERGETCWVPISLVHAGYLSSGLDALPSTNGHDLVGLSAGTDLQAAAERAAAHVIAHDAVARWWRKPSPLPECELPAALQPANDRGSAHDMRVLAVPTSTRVRVRLVVVDDREKNIVSLGFAAAAEPQDAALRAAAEALIQHASAQDLDTPDSLIRHAERIGLSASSVARVRRRTIPDGSASDAWTGARPLSARFGADTRVVVVDVTTPRVREAGYSACRVLAPGFERIEPAAFPGTIDASPPYPGW